MIEKILREIGLPENEIKVYLALLELGPSLAGKITKKSGVHRANVYGALDRLADKGLTSFIIQNKRKYFQAIEPSKIINMLRDKKEQIEQQEKNIQAILPELLSKTALLNTKLDAQIFSGKQGLRAILDDVLKTKPEEWLDITSGETIKILPYYMDKWNKLRADNNIKARVLFNNTQEGRDREEQIKKFKLTKTRFLPWGFTTPAHFYVYENKAVISVWLEEEPFGIIIENKAIANSFRNYFEWFWKLAKP